MGDGMARNLIKGGRDVVVWNRTGSKAAKFGQETGCEVAETPREVGSCVVVCSCSFVSEWRGSFPVNQTRHPNL